MKLMKMKIKLFPLTKKNIKGKEESESTDSRGNR